MKTSNLPMLTCSCCGGDAGSFEQHYNRDEGYGICSACVSWSRGRGTSQDEMTRLYGIAGVNFEEPMYSLYGKRFLVLAEFLATDIGRAQANQFMTDNDGAALLAEVNGRLILAHKSDQGVL